MEILKEDVYMTPKIEVINLSNLDVITTSGEIEENLGDDNWQT